MANGKAKPSPREAEILTDFFGLPINGTSFECCGIIMAKTVSKVLKYSLPILMEVRL